jgi:hypothetical protein
MLTGIPSYVTIIFIATVLLTLYLFIRATKKKVIVLILCLAWLVVQGRIAYSGFYQNTQTLPPHFALAVAPMLLMIIILFAIKKGRKFIDGFNLRTLTLLSIVRVPVELVLYLLFLHKAIPQLMTFAGRNFDILAGLTAPIVYFACFKNNSITNRRLLLVWNIVSLLLLLNIVINAVLSAPFRFQVFAFDQPNIAILYFPFVWLPSFIVVAVLFSHLTAIRRLTKNKTVSVTANGMQFEMHNT